MASAATSPTGMSSKASKFISRLDIYYPLIEVRILDETAKINAGLGCCLGLRWD
jgi:hypothetical protein